MKGKHLLFHIVVSLALIKNAASVSRIDPLVDTTVGLVRGLRATDGDYSMFLGIPYAHVDVSNPFGQSIPHLAFDGTFEAFDDSALCPQVGEQWNSVGNLDCLHLNIYVPNSASSKNRLPVMVWIHGGGFASGSGRRDECGPSYLVRHDVILVTINYRLGPYGFMCLDTPEVPGNQGLRDQQLALKWIKGNIEAFGGDVNKITLFGESAGAMSIDYHLFYRKDNTFNQAIMQSGSALSPLIIIDSDTSAPIKLAKHLGLKSGDLEEALSFLTTADTDLVIAATMELGLIFRPCVEKSFDGVESFIDDHPINLLPTVKDIPIIIGSNSDEALVWISIQNAESQKNVILDYLNQSLNFGNEQLDEVEALLKHFYIGDEEINESSLGALIDFDSDFHFNHPLTRSILKYLENGAKTIYQYVFSYNGGRNISKQMLNITTGGAAHADELGYLFGPFFENEEITLEDLAVIDRITTLWTNFAKYGNPTPETSEPVTWPTVTKDTLPYLNIDSELTVKSRSLHGRMAFWDLFYKLYYKSQKGYRDDA